MSSRLQRMLRCFGWQGLLKQRIRQMVGEGFSSSSSTDPAAAAEEQQREPEQVEEEAEEEAGAEQNAEKGKKETLAWCLPVVYNLPQLSVNAILKWQQFHAALGVTRTIVYVYENEADQLQGEANDLYTRFLSRDDVEWHTAPDLNGADQYDSKEHQQGQRKIIADCYDKANAQGFQWVYVELDHQALGALSRQGARASLTACCGMQRMYVCAACLATLTSTSFFIPWLKERRRAAALAPTTMQRICSRFSTRSIQRCQWCRLVRARLSGMQCVQAVRVYLLSSYSTAQHSTCRYGK